MSRALALLGTQTPALTHQPISPKSCDSPAPSSGVSHMGKPWLSSGLDPQLEQLTLQSATALLSAWPCSLDLMAWKVMRDTDLLAQSWGVGEVP